MTIRITSMILILGATTSAHAGLTINVLPSSDYNSNTAQMDQTLGITGYSIYNFQTETLPPLLTSINLAFPSSSMVTDTTLPQLYQPSADSAAGQSFASNNWAGPTAYAFNNTPGNALSTTTSNFATTTTFNFATGVTSIGIGLGNFQSLSSSQDAITDHYLYINGVAQTSTLEQIAGANWTPGIFGMNGYLEITATGGQSIQSIGFGNISGSDFLVFSHLAINSPAVVPEPSSVVLCALGIVGATGFLGLRRRRRSPATVAGARRRA